ncbi:MAG: flagellar biosynthesis anti-sigma factor FlgM [Lachnospiraceae bacterium]
MRIGNYQMIQQIYNTTKPASTGKTQKKGFSDVVSISNAGKDVSAAKAAVAASPDVRTELVDSIKSRIQAGTYDVSADDFADKLVAKFNGEF